MGGDASGHGFDGKRLAFKATLHCLTGCGFGEVLGMVLGTAFNWGDVPTIALSVGLAFFFGYSLTLWPLIKSGMSLRQAARVALAADTFSIVVMEIVDNGVMLLIPGAMDVGLAEPLFWGAMALALALAFAAAFPVNVWLIGRGRGHAAVHSHHAQGPHETHR